MNHMYLQSSSIIRIGIIITSYETYNEQLFFMSDHFNGNSQSF